MIEAEEAAVGNAAEVELMGIDGRIYKGRAGDMPGGGGGIPGVITDLDRGMTPGPGGVELPDIQQVCLFHSKTFACFL